MNLLGSAAYDPAAAVSKATSSLLALTALDTTNLRLAITVPAHGKVKFIMRGTITGATTVPGILFGVLNGATVLKRAAPQLFTGTQDRATQDTTAVAEFTVTGLAPGAMNVDAAYAVQVIVAATNIKYGGPNDATGNDAWGAFVFEAWDPQPMPLAIAPGAAGGLLIAGANAATTFATLTSTGAFSVNGVNDVAQTGDSFARVGAPVGASISADIAAVQADTDNIQTRLPAALVTGRMDVSVGAMAANVLTATAINADAITAAKVADGTIDALTFAAGAINAAAIAADAITDAKVAADVTIASVTGAVGSVTGAVGSVTGAVTVGTNNDKTGYALSAAGVQAIWDALTSALTTVGSVGKRIADNLDVVLSTRSTPTNITAGTITTVTNLTNAPTAGDFTAVMKTSLNAATPAVTVSDKTGFSLSAAGITAIWDKLTSALTTAGSIGKLLVDNVDAAISSRLATSGYTAPPSAATNASAVWNEATAGHTTAGTFGKLLNDDLDATISSRLATSGYTAPPSAAVVADAVWDEVLSGHLTASTTGNALNAAGAAGDPWTTALPGAYGAGTAGNIIGNKVDATISSRLSAAGYTAPDNTDIVAIRAKTDNLPSDPADASDIAASFGTVAALVTGLTIPTKIAIADEVATRTLKANVKQINDTTLKGTGVVGDQFGPV